MLARMVITATMVLVLAGCSSDDDSTDVAHPSPSSPSAREFRTTCERFEATTRDLDVVSSAGALSTTVDELVLLSSENGVETRQELAAVLAAVHLLQRAVHPIETRRQRPEVLDLRDAYAAARGELADVCAAAGSSALQ